MILLRLEYIFLKTVRGAPLKKNLNASRLRFLQIKKRSVLCSVPSNIRTGPTYAKKGTYYEKSKKNKRKKKNKKIGPRRKSDVAGDMLDKGDKEAIAPTRQAKPIKIKQKRRKDHQSTQLFKHNKIARFYPSCTCCCCVVWFIIKKEIRTRPLFKKNLNASKPSEHPPQVEECLKV